jgi:hypothetical protein
VDDEKHDGVMNRVHCDIVRTSDNSFCEANSLSYCARQP